MCSSRAAPTVEGMVHPIITQELVRARQDDVARKLRHAHHTTELPPTVFASAAVRLRDALLKRDTRARSVAAPRNLGSAADAVEKA
jgi:hypothetical protein